MSPRLAAAALGCALLIPSPVSATPVKVGRATLTYYWLIDEHAPAYCGAPDAVLRDAHGHVIAHTTRKFRRALVVEGSGWLKDGRAVMYDCRRHGEHRFRISKARYGLAVTGCALVPFRSVAVDPHFIKLGTKIYIPQLKGARLPDGTIHDGIFTATDRGHFRGHRVDIFVGEGPRGVRSFARRGYGSRSHVTVYAVNR